MSKTKLISSVGVLALVVTLVLQNTSVASVDIFFWKISMSRAILYPLLIIVGFAAGWAASLYLRKND